MTATLAARSSFNHRLKGWPGWIVLLFLAVLFVVMGAVGNDGVSTPEERADAISRRLACPECNGETVYESQVTASVNIRREIQAMVDEGRLSDDEIVAALEENYGERLLLLPTGKGVNVLVWALPVAAGVAGLTGLVLVFSKWRREAALEDGPTDEDRALVAAALDDES
ncbi:cytochrome c-type biogenesis protein [Desertimonas flava]|uniref:cytochrome c-type biogenesis protein n=1 Tax=Desertimonas flava TaxID=2064846 RepID=UPI000E3464F3|nr:cytochrome c-type biogenesis protein [Desertimonas flava]